MLKRRNQILLLIFLVLGVFYPTLFAEFTCLDDELRAEQLMNVTSWSLKQVFFPGSKGGTYYRPLSDLSFILDKDLWFLDAGFMHLENILLHLGNVLLVFFIVRALLPSQERQRSYLPLIAGSIFAVHPLSTEVVNWVSGRTDLMAGTFILLSALCLFRFRESRSRWLLLGSFLSLLIGAMCKEVAIAFVPGAFVILTARDTTLDTDSASHRKPANYAKMCGLFTIIAAATALFVYVLRSYAYTSSSGKIGLTLKIIANDPVHSLFVCLRAFGFYMKMFYLPFPLNFGTVEVDPLYELLAMPLVVFCLYLFAKRTLYGAIFLAGTFLIIPVYPIAFNQIAWTPYAERYIYVASAFIVTASVLFAYNHLKAYRRPQIITVAVFLLLTGLVIITNQRNIVWMKNVTLFQDTVNKSPNFNMALNLLGTAFFNAHDYTSAGKQFSSAASKPAIGYNDWANLNLAAVANAEGKPDLAIKLCEETLVKTKGNNENALHNIIKIYEDQALHAPKKATNYWGKVAGYYLQLYKITGDPYYLYRAGHLTHLIGNNSKSLEYYREALTKFPEGSEYKTYCRKIVTRLERE